MKYKIVYLLAFTVLCAATIQFTSCKWFSKNKAEQVADSIAILFPELYKISNEIKDKPKDASLYFTRAQYLYQAGSLEFAAKDMNTAIKLDPSKADYFVFFSEINLQAKFVQLAVNNLLEAKKLDPNNIDILIKLAKAYLILKQYNEAVTSCNSALQLNPSDVRAYLLQSIVSKEMGDTAKAIKILQIAVEKNSDYFDAYMQLGLLCDKTNNKLAEQYYKNAIRIDSAKFEANYALALYYQKHAQMANAISIYKSMIKQYPQEAQPMFNLGALYFDNHDYVNAENHFNLCTKVDPQNYKAYYYRGLSKEQQRKYAEAQQDFKQALTLEPKFLDAEIALQKLVAKVTKG